MNTRFMFCLELRRGDKNSLTAPSLSKFFSLKPIWFCTALNAHFIFFREGLEWWRLNLVVGKINNSFDFYGCGDWFNKIKSSFETVQIFSTKKKQTCRI